MNANKIFTNVFNIMIHMCILLIILTLIFWLVIKNVEENSINEEVTKNIRNVFSKIREDMTHEKRIEASNIIKNSKKELEVLNRFYSEPYEVKEVNNNWLFQNNILYIAILVVAITVLILTIKFYSKSGKNFNMFATVRENLVLFSLIGAIEIWFFYEIGMKFIPTKPSLVISSTVSALKDNFN